MLNQGIALRAVAGGRRSFGRWCGGSADQRRLVTISCTTEKLGPLIGDPGFTSRLWKSVTPSLRIDEGTQRRPTRSCVSSRIDVTAAPIWLQGAMDELVDIKIAEGDGSSWLAIRAIAIR